MRFTPRWFGPLACLGLVLGALTGCDGDTTTSAVSAGAAPRDEDKKPPVKRVEVGKNVVLEIQEGSRRVLIEATVCLQKGPLELLMCKQRTKEHEAILSADVDARDVHKALLLTGAKPGSPVEFEPKYVPAHGDTIKVTLEYESKGKKITVSAQDWIRNSKTKKTLTDRWVFAGSKLVQNPLDNNKPLYMANEGDVVCISNFETALLDLPVKVSKDNSELAWECNTEVIPPVDTKVTIILEPVLEKKKN